MKCFILGVILVVSISEIVALPQKRIVGGSISEFEPWYAHVSASRATEKSIWGGGAFLSDRVVLTQAALINGFNFWSISYGSTDTENVHTIPIDRVIIHPFFSPKTFENDIGLLRTQYSTELDYPGYVQPVTPYENDIELPFEFALFLGWGYHITEPFESPEQLQRTHFKLITTEECQELLGDQKEIITSTHLCAISMDDTSAACNNDQGGPLMNNLVPGNVVMGIASIVTHLCHPRYPMLFTNVPLFAQWIENMKNILSN